MCALSTFSKLSSVLYCPLNVYPILFFFFFSIADLEICFKSKIIILVLSLGRYTFSAWSSNSLVTFFGLLPHEFNIQDIRYLSNRLFLKT